MMETLATQLIYQGRRLRQLKRDGMVAIYDVRNRGNVVYGYEVIMIKALPVATFPDGRSYPEREGYPSSRKESNDWGTIAWSYPANGCSKALAQFNGLVKEGARVPPSLDHSADDEPGG